MKSTYRHLSNLVGTGKTKEQLLHLEKRVTRLYDNGLISATDLSRLDVKIMEKIARIETQEQAA